jgi:hypothetical protein
MHSPWGSDIGRNSLVMSGTGIPVRSPFPIGFGPEEKNPPRQRIEMGMRKFSSYGAGLGSHSSLPSLTEEEREYRGKGVQPLSPSLWTRLRGLLEWLCCPPFSICKVSCGSSWRQPYIL